MRMPESLPHFGLLRRHPFSHFRPDNDCRGEAEQAGGGGDLILPH